MTENEAINELQANIDLPFGFTVSDEVSEIAIQALEEIKAYRAIGTVEGYERAIQSSVENYNLYREYKAKVQEYEAIGTIDEFNALKEKDEPKKPIEYYKCPTCKNYALDNDGVRYKYCPYCGTKIDWQ